MLKALTAGALAGALVLSTAAMAAGTQGALAPGKAASVKEAQWMLVNGQWVWLVGAGLVIGGVAATLSGSGNGTVGATNTCPLTGCPTPTPTTTTSTSTSPTTSTSTTTP